MKVLEQGKWNMKWERQIFCKHKDCGAKLLAEEMDLRFRPNCNLCFFVICPVCASKVFIEAEYIPERVREETKGRETKRSDSSCPNFRPLN